MNKHYTLRGGKIIHILCFTIFMLFHVACFNELKKVHKEVSSNKVQSSQEVSGSDAEEQHLRSEYYIQSDLKVNNKVVKVISKYIDDQKQVKELANAVTRYGQKYKFDPLLLLGVVRVESHFQKQAISKGDCWGYFQINHRVHGKHFTQNFLGDVYEQTYWACKILDHARSRSNGNTYTMLNGYNGWWSNSNPYAQKVIGYRQKYKGDTT